MNLRLQDISPRLAALMLITLRPGTKPNGVHRAVVYKGLQPCPEDQDS